MKIDFLESLKQFDDFLSAKGVNSEAIHAAEAALSLRFSSEYKSYLSECGFVSAVEYCWRYAAEQGNEPGDSR